MILGIHHFALIASSLSSVEFYEKLGFKEIKRIERKDDLVVLMEGHAICIEIFVDARHPARPLPEPLGLRHIALEVENIEKTVEKLGLDASPIGNDWVGRRFCFVADPDGNRLELRE